MEINTKSFEDEVLKSKIPVLLECWASWCLPCKQLDPQLSKYADEYVGKCKILKINVDKNPDISEKYNIRGLPTLLTFVSGQLYERKVGSISNKQIKALIENAINKYNASSENTSLSHEEQEIIEKRLKDLNYM